jgi:hypothetical protein
VSLTVTLTALNLPLLPVILLNLLNRNGLLLLQPPLNLLARLFNGKTFLYLKIITINKMEEIILMNLFMTLLLIVISQVDMDMVIMDIMDIIMEIMDTMILMDMDMTTKDMGIIAILHPELEMIMEVEMEMEAGTEVVMETPLI